MLKVLIISLTTFLLATTNIAASESFSTMGSEPIAFSRPITILTYHYIGYNPNPGRDDTRDSLSITPAEFEKELQRLAKEGYTPITLDKMQEIMTKKSPAPKRPIVLTFDDGYVDFYINAYPLLRKYNYPAVEFIPTGLIGDSGYLTWDMIKDMDESGLISFQAHTVSHPYLPYLTYQETLKELTDSKTRLEKELGKEVDFVAYPYGASNQSVQKAAKEAGYKAAFGTWLGMVTDLSLNMPRVRAL